MAVSVPNERIAGFDWLRGWAILAVVLIHSSDGALHRNNDFPKRTLEGAFYFALSACARFCVPGFLIMAGFLAERRMERTGEAPAIRWKRYALPLLIASPIYLFLYFAEKRFQHQSVSPSFLLSAALTGQAYYHLWFLYWLLLFTLLHPGLRLFAAPRAFGVVMAGFAALFAALPGHQELFRHSLLASSLGAGLPGIGYYIAGIWSARNAERLRRAVLVWAAGALIAGMSVSCLYGIMFHERSFYNPGAASLSIGAFLWALRISAPPPAALRLAGALSLGIYLWHPLFLTALRFVEKRLIHGQSSVLTFGLMGLEFVVAVAGSAALSACFTRIPALRSLAL